MNAVQQGEFHCSCGRSFVSEIKLQRHYKITNHLPIGESPEEVVEVVAAAVEVKVDAEDTYETALRIIAQKRIDIAQEESRRRAEQLAVAFREEQRRQFAQFVGYLVAVAQATSLACLRKVTKVGSIALATGAFLLMAVILTSVGAGIGKSMAQSHNAPSWVAYR